MVHQYATNDRRIFPPSGLPLGNMQRSYQNDLPFYPANELSALSFPHDYATSAPFAPYDIWGDAFNVTAEFVNPQQARSLAATAYLMAKTSLKNQPWRTANASINFSRDSVSIGQSSTATLQVDNLSISSAQIVWEARSHEPTMANQLEVTPSFIGRYWVEAEALLPDGRRVSAASELISGAVAPSLTPVAPGTIRVSGTSGQAFLIEASEDLSNWIPVFNGIFTDQSVDWTDDTGLAGVRFYRVAAGL
jgi:hypothetical protein